MLHWDDHYCKIFKYLYGKCQIKWVDLFSIIYNFLTQILIFKILKIYINRVQSTVIEDFNVWPNFIEDFPPIEPSIFS